MNTTEIRNQFPALQRTIDHQPIVFLDGPAGTQVPTSVIEAISHYYRHCNANTHGYFVTSQETDVIMEQTREKVAAFLGAPGANCISFGQNMTTLNFSLSKALLRTMQPGDEIFITQLDHEANRGPWLNLQEHGIVIHEIKLLPDGQLDYDDFAGRISEKTKLVCVGYASNILGTVNDIGRITQIARKVGARILVDAVHYAAHFKIDVSQLDIDFLLCSAYKFYGPHVGILYCRPGLLDTLTTDRLRTQDAKAPYRIETGTLNHAAIAGVGAAIDFIASLGQGDTYTSKLTRAMQQIHQHEMDLARQLAQGLQGLPGIKIYGPPVDQDHRAPTLAFTHEQSTPAELCQYLGKQGICAWDGHFYAIRATEVLHLLERGGVTRMGLVAYNTVEEVERTIRAVAAFGNRLLQG